MKRTKRHQRDWADTAGFTLIEALIATALMVAILVALATVTAQWIPNWNRGFARVQRTELASVGLERIVADLAAAEFIAPLGDSKSPLFDGGPLSVTFERSALGPNTRPGLEVVRIAETTDERGLAMVRARSPFMPVTPDAFGQVQFSDPVVLMRAPYRVSFAYADRDGVWQDTWRGGTALPRAVRVTVRDAATAQVLPISTTVVIHDNAPAECVRTKDCEPPKQSAPNTSGDVLVR